MPNVFLTTFFFLTCLCRIFGHFSHRSEWQLVKIDFRSIFQHRCTTDDYMTWQLHNEVRGSRRHSTVDDTIQSSIKLEWNALIQSNNKSKTVGKKKEEMKGKEKGTSEMYMMHYSSQGEVCIMGMKRIYQKLKANVRCVKAREQYISQMSDSCPCTEADFEWWVPCSAATLFTSLNPMHNTLSISRGTVCEARLRHNKRSATRLIFYNSQLLSLTSVTSLVTWDVKTVI